MKGKVLLLTTLLLVLLTGCFGGGYRKPVIHLSWKVLPEIEMLSEEEEKNVVGNRFIYAHTEMDKNWIEIEAEVSGKAKSIKIQPNTQNPFQKLSESKILLEPLQAEQSDIVVQADDQIEVFDYVIFPAAVIKIFDHPKKETAFSFEQGGKVLFEDADLWFTVPPEEERGFFKADVCIVDMKVQDFWVDFIQANNLHEYEYSIQAFKPELNKLYFIKTKNNHYAVMRFTASAGDYWNFMYKYSESGVFPEYQI